MNLRRILALTARLKEAKKPQATDLTATTRRMNLELFGPTADEILGAAVMATRHAELKHILGNLRQGHTTLKRLERLKTVLVGEAPLPPEFDARIKAIEALVQTPINCVFAWAALHSMHDAIMPNWMRDNFGGDRPNGDTAQAYWANNQPSCVDGFEVLNLRYEAELADTKGDFEALLPLLESTARAAFQIT